MTQPPDSLHARQVLAQFGPMVYAPTALFALGKGAVLPLLPVIAANLGADIPMAALVSTAVVVGQLCGNLPAGWAVARIGERLTMAIAGTVALVGVIALALAPHLGLVALAMLLIGFCASAFALARHSFMTTRVPLAFRARALALLGGTFRFGMFVGPFAAAALLAIFGTTDSAIWLFGVCLVVTVALVLLGPDPEKQFPRVESRPSVTMTEDTDEPITGPVPTAAHAGVFRTMWRYRGVLSRLGLAASSLAAVRSARQIILPLWGVSIGLDAQTIALVVGISGALDLVLFYASGQVMDRFGRLWAALPSMVLMGAALIALAMTHDSPQSAMWFALFAAVIGVGNGLSSGILLTLGADAAPQDNPAPFLGSWRTLTDGGAAVAPLLMTAIAAAASLSIAAAAMGAIGLLGAAAFARWIPRFSPRP